MTFRPNSMLMNRNHSTQWMDYNTNIKKMSNQFFLPTQMTSKSVVTESIGVSVPGGVEQVRVVHLSSGFSQLLLMTEAGSINLAPLARNVRFLMALMLYKPWWILKDESLKHWFRIYKYQVCIAQWLGWRLGEVAGSNLGTHTLNITSPSLF